MGRTGKPSEPDSSPPINTFVIRFWREWSAGRPQWRGRIEHLQSGQSTAFLDLESMLEFVRSFGIMVGEEKGGAATSHESKG
ncbi:MAG: hypothetical protein JXA37_11610 [Chloroflexia bacterium]|nr:hypothetical protein [Chloroflexia bacterium]